MDAQSTTTTANDADREGEEPTTVVDQQPVSKYRGVTWYRPASKWVSLINISGQPTFLGYFNDEMDAARKYDEQALMLGHELNWPLHRSPR